MTGRANLLAVLAALAAGPVLADTPQAAQVPVPQPAAMDLTSNQITALRTAIAQCWNTGTLTTAQTQVVVTVAVTLDGSGKPEPGTFRLISASSTDDALVAPLYETARRAVIRCGNGGLPLPQNALGLGRDLVLTFQPSGNILP